MKVNNRMMEVNARVLQQPTLSYGSPSNFDPRVGVVGAAGGRAPGWAAQGVGD